MALNIKDKEAEQLAAEVAALAGESKTGAVRQALRERRERLRLKAGGDGARGELTRFLETEVWPLIPAEQLDQPPLSKAEREEILGIGPQGH